jgi:hypothetical protein
MSGNDKEFWLKPSYAYPHGLTRGGLRRAKASLGHWLTPRRARERLDLDDHRLLRSTLQPGPAVLSAAVLAHRYCALLSAQSGVEEIAIWQWGFLERVSSGLYCLDLGIEELGRPFLQTAEMLSAEHLCANVSICSGAHLRDLNFVDHLRIFDYAV